MKTKIKMFLTVLLLLLLALFTLPAQADPQGYLDVPLATNLVAGVTNTTAGTGGTVFTTLGNTNWFIPGTGQYLPGVNGGLFKIPQGSQLIFQPNWSSVGVGNSINSNAWVGFNFCADGNFTNLSTVTPLWLTNTLNGPTNVVGHFVISFTNFTGDAYGQLTTFGTTAITNTTLNSLKIGYKTVLPY